MQGGCNEVVKDSVRRSTRCRAGLLGVWAALWTGCVLALALGMAGTAYADSQYQPTLAGVVQGPTPWAEYNGDEYYDGYLVYGANKYDCLIYALGLNPDDFDLVARGKLSSASTGGRFYEVLQSGYNDNCPSWVNISFYEGWLRQCGITPPSNTNPQWLWAFEIYPDDYEQAREDAETVKNGGDIDDDGGGSGSIGEDGFRIVLEPWCSFFDGMAPPTTWSYPVGGSRMYTALVAGASIPNSLIYKIKPTNDIDLSGKKVMSYIWPTSSSTVSLHVWFGDSVSTTDASYQETFKKDNKDVTVYYPWVKSTLTGEIYHASISLSNVIQTDTLNARFNKVSNTSYSVNYGGYQSGMPTGFFWYDGGLDLPVEPSPDPWPDPEPTTPTPQPPELPEPNEPVVPDPPDVSDPDPNPTPTPRDPVIPTPPDLPDVDVDTDFTADLSGIIDALNEHCVHIQTCLNTNFSNQNTYLGQLLNVCTNAITTTINNGDIAKIDAIASARNYITMNIVNNMNYGFDMIARCIADSLDYFSEFTKWLDKKLDYQFPEFSDTSIVYWLKRLYYKRGTGTDSRPVDPVTDPFGIGDWLRNLANLLIQALEGIAPGLVGDLLSKIDLLTGKFPFSLPWDIMAVLGAFVAQPEAPSVEWPCYAYQNGQIVQVATYDVDMSAYDGVMEGVRFVGFLGFAVYTMTLVPKWVDDLMGVVESA